jgi:hypothetical protein
MAGRLFGSWKEHGRLLASVLAALVGRRKDAADYIAKTGSHFQAAGAKE